MEGIWKPDHDHADGVAHPLANLCDLTNTASYDDLYAHFDSAHSHGRHADPLADSHPGHSYAWSSYHHVHTVSIPTDHHFYPCDTAIDDHRCETELGIGQYHRQCDAERHGLCERGNGDVRRRPRDRAESHRH